MKSAGKSWKIVVGVVAFLVLAGGYYARGRLADVGASEGEAMGHEETKAKAAARAVVVTAAAEREFRDVARVQGTLESRNFAVVSPRVGGVIERIFVDEGDAVAAGETQLFQIDAVKLEKALEIARQTVAVSRCALLERQANEEKVEADLYKAQLDYKRFAALLKKEVVTANAFELQELHYKQAKASCKHAETSVALAKEEVLQAEASLAIATKDLDDTLIYAPLTGVVSARLMEPGEMGGVGRGVLRIEDPSLIEVSAFLPSQDYNKVRPGQTRMDVEVNGVKVREQVIVYKSPTIDPVLRTFEIKSVITDPPAGVVPGALAEIEVAFGVRRSVGVPSVCVLERRSGAGVFVVEGEAARLVAVEAGWEYEGWREMVQGEVALGSQVVSMGQDQLNDGDAVKVQKGVE